MSENDIDNNLSPAHHQANENEFTPEELEDILRYANVHDLNAVDTARLIRFVKDVQKAHTRRAHSKGEATSWPNQTQST
jgi:hypothetical protein